MGDLSVLELRGKLRQPFIADRRHHHAVQVFSVMKFGLSEDAFLPEPDLLVDVDGALVFGTGLEEGAAGVRGRE